MSPKKPKQKIVTEGIEGPLMLFVTALAVVVTAFGVLQGYDRELAQRVTRLESEVIVIKDSCCSELYYLKLISPRDKPSSKRP